MLPQSSVPEAPVAPQEHILTKDGFCTGVLSHEFFLEWVNGSDRVKAAKVTSIAWFRSNRNVLHHQFIIATVAYTARNDMVETLYDIKIERMGRMVGPGAKAKQTITIKQAVPLAENLRNDANELLLGLVDEHNSLRDGSLPSQPLFSSYYDERWRGSEASLGLLARYSSVVVDNAPAYHLSSTNCYFYARLIMHIMIERHLSFEHAVFPSAHRYGMSAISPVVSQTDQGPEYPPVLVSAPSRRSFNDTNLHLCVFFFVGQVVKNPWPNTIRLYNVQSIWYSTSQSQHSQVRVRRDPKLYIF